MRKEINVKITAIHNADCLIENAISHVWVQSTTYTQCNQFRDINLFAYIDRRDFVNPTKYITTLNDKYLHHVSCCVVSHFIIQLSLLMIYRQKDCNDKLPT